MVRLSLRRGSGAAPAAAAAEDPVQEEAMRTLAAALLSEACARTGARLADARSLEPGLPHEDAVRTASADGRRLLQRMAAGDAATRPTALELLKALAALEGAAQLLLAEASDDGARAARRELRAQAEAAASTGLPLELPGSFTFAAAEAADAAADGCAAAASSAPAAPQGRQGRRAKLRSFLSSTFLGSSITQEAAADGCCYGPDFDASLLKSWASHDSALFKSDGEMLEQLARDAQSLLEAQQCVASMVEDGGGQLDEMEADVNSAAANAEMGLRALVGAAEGYGKRRGFKTAIASGATGITVGALAGAPVCLALGVGAVVAPIGYGASRLVQNMHTRRASRMLAERDQALSLPKRIA